MKNRTIPYGYCYVDGKIVIHPNESETVQKICSAYCEGKSLLAIANWLNEEQIEYMSGIVGWNKSRIKRLIEDERYTGKNNYPAIIDKETHIIMQKIMDDRNTQKSVDRQQDIFKITVPVKCPCCGGKMNRKHDKRCKCQQQWRCENIDCGFRVKQSDTQMLHLLYGIIEDLKESPESIEKQCCQRQEPSIEVRRLNNEISRMLDAVEIDKETLKKKILEGISQKYKESESPAYTAQKLRNIFTSAEPGNYRQILNRTANAIILYGDMTAGIVLLNGQLIRKGQTNGTAANS